MLSICHILKYIFPLYTGIEKMNPKKQQQIINLCSCQLCRLLLQRVYACQLPTANKYFFSFSYIKINQNHARFGVNWHSEQKKILFPTVSSWHTNSSQCLFDAIEKCLNEQLTKQKQMNRNKNKELEESFVWQTTYANLLTNDK